MDYYMIKLIITFILIGLLYFFINQNIINIDNFENKFDNNKDYPLPELTNPFVHLYDDKGTKLNIVLICQPLGSDDQYRKYMENMAKITFIGISSYMEFPYSPSNPEDNYKIEHFEQIQENFAYDKTTPYYLDMYFEMCKGWLHCFKNPEKYIPIDKPHILISESDFVNYKQVPYNPEIINMEREFDFIYSCPKVNEKSGCDDWVSHNKNWELAKKCLPILCEKFKLKGLLIGRKDCDIPKGCKPYITTTGWLDYGENIKQYNRCKFIFVPNVRDASPRVITEAMSADCAVLINKNILGGWKYAVEQTGELFNDETDIEFALNKFIPKLKEGKYKSRQYIIDNYGPVNSGRKLKEFLFKNFGDKINITDCDYITMRGKLSGYDELKRTN
jgi:hypothetical protein